MTCLRLTTTQSADIGLIAKGLVSLWLLDLGTGWKFDVSTIHGSVYFRGTFLSVSVDASQLLESSQKQYISIGFFLGWILIFVAMCLSKSFVLQLTYPAKTCGPAVTLCEGDGMAEPPTRFVVHPTCQGMGEESATFGLGR